MSDKQYTYEFATRIGDRWTSSWHRTAPRHRAPREIARGVLERWIVDQARQLPAGRLIVYGRRRAAVPPEGVTARVRVYDGTHAGDAIRPVAVAYLLALDRDERAARRRGRTAR